MPAPEKKYARLRAMGADRVTAINSMLNKGATPGKVARMIQQEWKEFQDVAEKTLTQQLNRYKLERLDPLVNEASPDMVPLTEGLSTVLNGNRVPVIEQAGQLIALQMERIKIGFKREKEAKMLVTSVNKEVETLMNLLEKTQKMQFDLGLDEFKGPAMVPSNLQGRMLGVQVNHADGSKTSVVSQELESAAVGALEAFGLSLHGPESRTVEMEPPAQVAVPHRDE